MGIKFVFKIVGLALLILAMVVSAIAFITWNVDVFKPWVWTPNARGFLIFAMLPALVVARFVHFLIWE
jgi:hypothetical protein